MDWALFDDHCLAIIVRYCNLVPHFTSSTCWQLCKFFETSKPHLESFEVYLRCTDNLLFFRTVDHLLGGFSISSFIFHFIQTFLLPLRLIHFSCSYIRLQPSPVHLPAMFLLWKFIMLCSASVEICFSSSYLKNVDLLY